MSQKITFPVIYSHSRLFCFNFYWHKIDIHFNVYTDAEVLDSLVVVMVVLDSVVQITVH